MRYEEFNSSSILQDAFHIYRRNNLVRSQAVFSRRILGCEPSYYSCMTARDRRPSRRVLETLLTVTKTILGTFLGNPHFRKPYAENLNQAYEQLEQLVSTISVELSLSQVVEGLEDDAVKHVV